MTTSRTIIITIALLFVCSFSFLAFAGWKQQQYDYSHLWWTLSFNDPESNDLSFTIENHSDQTAFHWEILLDKTSISKGDATLNIGETKSIPAIANDVAGRTVTIKITTPKGSKDIYKKF
jgi:hypothetical protein